MEDNKITWKVGDIVLIKSHYHGWGEAVISRVTATQAAFRYRDREWKIRQGESDGQTAIGDKGFYLNTHFSDTPKARAQMLADKNREYFYKYELGASISVRHQSELSDSKITQIVGIHKAAMAEISNIINSQQ